MTSTPEQVIANITPQMIRDAAGWSQSEEDLRDTLRLAAVALDASEAEKADILAELLQSRMEIMSRGETITILEAERDALRKAAEALANQAEHCVMGSAIPGMNIKTAMQYLAEASIAVRRTLAGDNHE